MAIVLNGTTNDILVNGVSVATDTEVSSAVAPLASTVYVDAQDALKASIGTFTGTNQSLAANGYQKLPGGLIIQWGTTGTTNDGTSGVTVTYPIAFPNAVFHVSYKKIGSMNGTGTGDDRVASVTLTSFVANGGTVAGDNYWFAIGY